MITYVKLTRLISQYQNVNGVIQHQSGKLLDHMNTLSKQSEEQRNLDKKESQKQLLAVTTKISDKVEACHSEEKRVIELQTIELKGAFEKRQQREESRLCAIHKDVEIIKGIYRQFVTALIDY